MTETKAFQIDSFRLSRLAVDGLPWIRKFTAQWKADDEQRMRRLQATLQPEVVRSLPVDCQKKEFDGNQSVYCCFRHIIYDTWFARVRFAPANVLNPKNNPPERIRQWFLQITEWGDRTEWTPEEFETLLNGLNGVHHALTTELLGFLNPQRYCIWNSRLDSFVRYLRKTRVLHGMPSGLRDGEKYRLYHQILDEVRSVLDRVDEEGIFDRPINYYHADRFVWYVANRKTWLVAAGRGGQMWEAFRNCGCIGISWKEAARQIPDHDFTRLGKAELKSLFQKVYRREGRGGWQQVWKFLGHDMNEDMQPGEIVVARAGTNTIVGIGVIRSEVLPPRHPKNPFASSADTAPLHIRWVGWRVVQPLEFPNLSQQTMTKLDEERWKAIVKGYRDQGIDVYEQLLSPKPISLHTYFQSRGYRFASHQIAAFYAALKTKGFVILSGLSGTGKTKLALYFAELLCPRCRGLSRAQPDEGEREHHTHLFLSVRPDWRDGKALLGYYNPLTERYESTPLIRFILRAIDDYTANGAQAQPYFIILDEMNLSHVEYYFADFLSVLESGRREDGFTREPIRLYATDLPAGSTLRQMQGIPSEIHLSPNLYIIGTVNVDETTYTFSPKVLDRAFTLEFRDVDLRDYPLRVAVHTEDPGMALLRDRLRSDLAAGGRFCTLVADKQAISGAVQALGDAKQWLRDLHGRLIPYDLHFGFRVMDEIALFVQHAMRAPESVDSLSSDEALDLAVLMKVLPKFHGPRQRLEQPLLEVARWCLRPPVHLSERIDLNGLLKSIRGTPESGAVPGVADVLREWDSFKMQFRFPHTARKALQMLRQLLETGFTAFAG